MDKSQDAREIQWTGKFIQVVTDGGWEYVERVNTTGIIGIVPITDDGKLVLVEQYRPPVKCNVIELPAGLVGDVAGQEDEAMSVAAERELLEETGYRAGRMVRLFEGVASAGLSAERMTFFLATGLQKVHEGGGDESEDIVVHEVPISEVTGWLASRRAEGMLIDIKIYSALAFCT